MNKPKALVSIVVPVYGTEAYLSACIDSLCKQSYSNIEIILVDDQSPDGCPEICDSYAKKDSRIIVIHQENKGVSGARNAGMKQSNGEFIMFVDSDDELYLNAVELLLGDVYKYAADIVSATKKVVDENNNILSAFEDGSYSVFRDDEPLCLSLQGNRNTNSACAKLFKTDFIKDIYFEEGKNINEDGFFVFQCYMRKPVLVQHDVSVYQYNVRSESNSRQSFSEKYMSMLYFCERKKELVFKYYPQHINEVHNMEVRTNLQFLQVMCRSSDKSYNKLQRKCINTVCKLYGYHKPINKHHRKLAWIVAHNLYPLYKQLIFLKYYR